MGRDFVSLVPVASGICAYWHVEDARSWNWVVMLTSKTWAVNDAWAPIHQFPAFPDSGIKRYLTAKFA